MGIYKERADKIFSAIKLLADKHITDEQDKVSVNEFLTVFSNMINNVDSVLVDVKAGATFEEAGVRMIPGPYNALEADKEWLDERREDMEHITRDFASAPVEIKEQAIQHMHAFCSILGEIKQEINELYTDEQARNRHGMN